jgi:hypothetical protein
LIFYFDKVVNVLNESNMALDKVTVGTRAKMLWLYIFKMYVRGVMGANREQERRVQWRPSSEMASARA